MKLTARLLALLLMAEALQGSNCNLLIKVGTMDAPHSYIAVLKDNRDKRFLLKQRKIVTAYTQFMTVIEAFSTWLAESLHIPCNHVELIATSSPCTHKHYPDYPATLHTFLPGKTIALRGTYQGLTIQQRCKGHAPIDCSLNRKLIRTMAVRGELARIIAVDAFLGNNSRHRSNLLYDKKNDTFYAIDYGSCLRVNLCEKNKQALNKINLERLTSSERQALKMYTTQLKKIVKHFTPRDLCNKLDEFFQRSKLHKLPRKLSHQIRPLLLDAKKFIHESYASTKKLTQTLDLSLLKLSTNNS